MEDPLMATNIYDHRETDYYEGCPGKGCDMWGWLITTSGDSKSFIFFGSRKIMTKVMTGLMKRIMKLSTVFDEEKDEDRFEIAAILTVIHEKGTEEEYEWIEDVLPHLLTDEQFGQIAEAYDELGAWLRTHDLLGR
jgi:hypothetical protein